MALVEAAIATPLFLLVLIGVFEFGLAFRDYLTLSSATRAAARSASVSGSTAYADYQILQAIKSNSAAMNDSATITSIAVYKATGPSSTLANTGNSGCLVASSSTCNRYTAADLNRVKTDFGCGGSSPDRFWCPTMRKDRLSGPPDFVGVSIKVTHQNATGMLGNTRSFSDEVVMRIEPTAL